jgi:hypothetical protein
MFVMLYYGYRIAVQDQQQNQQQNPRILCDLELQRSWPFLKDNNDVD